MTQAFIALGGNLGDRLATLQRACVDISQLRETRITETSPIYQSRAVGPGEQANYLNAVISVETNFSALQTLDALQTIENAAGRVRNERWGPRTLDLDILLFGSLQIQSDRLTLPHSQLYQRDFVLRPLADIVSADWRFPDGSSPADHLASCADNELTLAEGSLIDPSFDEGARA